MNAMLYIKKNEMKKMSNFVLDYLIIKSNVDLIVNIYNRILTNDNNSKFETSIFYLLEVI